MKVLVVAEYYPSAADPSRGVWAHRQAIAARDAGAQVRVLVLRRPIPPLSAVRDRDLATAWRALRQPEVSGLDGVRVEYVRYLSPLARGATTAGERGRPRLWAARCGGSASTSARI